MNPTADRPVGKNAWVGAGDSAEGAVNDLDH
jgi:hypothetical protein